MIMKKTTLLVLAFAASCAFQSAQAAIVYTNNADQLLTANGTITIDFNNDGTPEFTFQDMGFGGAVEPAIMFASANHHLTTVSTGEWDVLRGENAGFTIDAFAGFFDMGDAYIDPAWATTSFPTTDTYIGAQFRIGTSDYFGWILVNWDANGNFIVKSFAYNSTANGSIVTGATGQSASLEENRAETLTLSPNPANNTVTLSVDAPTNVTLTDVLGNTLETRFISQSETLDLTNYKAGIYFVASPNGKSTKFIKL